MKLAILTGFILSASCQVLHQPQVNVHRDLEYYDTPNYQFAYSVNDAHTGDIKSQHENRRGESVLGQYSLLQPDGVTRTVDYRADEHAGFRASVNNGRPAQQQQVQDQNADARNNLEQSRNVMQDNVYANVWPSPRATPTPAVAVSRSSIVQTFSSPPQYPYQQQIW